MIDNQNNKEPLYYDANASGNPDGGPKIITGDQKTDAYLSKFDPSEWASKLAELNAPYSGEELDERIKIHGYDEYLRMNADEFLKWKEHRDSKKVDVLNALAEGAGTVVSTFQAAAASAANKPISTAAKLPATVLEAFLQGGHAMIGLATQSTDPTSPLFKFKSLLTGSGSVQEQMEQMRTAALWQKETEELFTGKKTILLNKDYINPEVTQALSFMVDPTVFIPFGGIAAKGARAIGMGEAMLKAQMKARMIHAGVLSGAIKWGVGAPLEVIGGALKDTIEFGVQAGAKGAENLVGVPAEEIVRGTRVAGIGTASASIAGYSVPYAGTAASAWMGGGIARSLGSALTTTAEQISKNSGERGVLSFARQALWETEKMGKTLAPQTRSMLLMLDRLDPIFSYSSSVLEAGAKGSAVGAGLGYAHGGVEGAASGAGFGLALAGGVGLVGKAGADVLGGTRKVREAITATLVHKLISEKDPETARAWSRIMADPRATPEIVSQIQKTMVGMEMHTEGTAVKAFENLREFIEYKRSSDESAIPLEYEFASSEAYTIHRTKDGRVEIGVNMERLFDPSKKYNGLTLAHEMHHVLMKHTLLGRSFSAMFRDMLLGVRDGDGNIVQKSFLPFSEVKDFFNHYLDRMLFSSKNVGKDNPVGNAVASRWGYIQYVMGPEGTLDVIQDPRSAQRMRSDIRKAIKTLEKEGGLNSKTPLSEKQMAVLNMMAEEFGSYAFSAWYDSKPMEFFMLGGKLEGFKGMIDMVKNAWMDHWETKVSYNEPRFNFHKLDAAKEIDSGFFRNGKRVRVSSMDYFFRDLIRASTNMNQTGAIDFGSMSQTLLEGILSNGAEEVLVRDETTRKIRAKTRKEIREDLSGKGTAMAKLLDSLSPELHEGGLKKNLDGKWVGMFNENQLKAAVQSGILSEGLAQNVRIIQRASSNPDGFNVLEHAYWGKSKETGIGPNPSRVKGNAVPITQRQTVVAGVDFEFHEDGTYKLNYLGLDFKVIKRRVMEALSIPAVRELYSSHEMLLSHFKDYLSNLSKPDGEKLPSAQYLEKYGKSTGATRRDIMHFIAGFAKAEGVQYANNPISSIPRGMTSSVTSFSIGRIMNARVTGENVPYLHANAFDSVAANFKIDSFVDVTGNFDLPELHKIGGGLKIRTWLGPYGHFIVEDVTGATPEYYSYDSNKNLISETPAKTPDEAAKIIEDSNYSAINRQNRSVDATWQKYFDALTSSEQKNVFSDIVKTEIEKGVPLSEMTAFKAWKNRRGVSATAPETLEGAGMFIRRMYEIESGKKFHTLEADLLDVLADPKLRGQQDDIFRMFENGVDVADLLSKNVFKRDAKGGIQKPYIIRTYKDSSGLPYVDFNRGEIVDVNGNRTPLKRWTTKNPVQEYLRKNNIKTGEISEFVFVGSFAPTKSRLSSILRGLANDQLLAQNVHKNRFKGQVEKYLLSTAEPVRAKRLFIKDTIQGDVSDVGFKFKRFGTNDTAEVQRLRGIITKAANIDTVHAIFHARNGITIRANESVVIDGAIHTFTYPHEAVDVINQSFKNGIKPDVLRWIPSEKTLVDDGIEHYFIGDDNSPAWLDHFPLHSTLQTVGSEDIAAGKQFTIISKVDGKPYKPSEIKATLNAQPFAEYFYQRNKSKNINKKKAAVKNIIGDVVQESWESYKFKVETPMLKIDFGNPLDLELAMQIAKNDNMFEDAGHFLSTALAGSLDDLSKPHLLPFRTNDFYGTSGRVIQGYGLGDGESMASRIFTTDRNIIFRDDAIGFNTGNTPETAFAYAKELEQAIKDICEANRPIDRVQYDLESERRILEAKEKGAPTLFLIKHYTEIIKEFADVSEKDLDNLSQLVNESKNQDPAMRDLEEMGPVSINRLIDKAHAYVLKYSAEYDALKAEVERNPELNTIENRRAMSDLLAKINANARVLKGSELVDIASGIYGNFVTVAIIDRPNLFSGETGTSQKKTVIWTDRANGLRKFIRENLTSQDWTRNRPDGFDYDASQAVASQRETQQFINDAQTRFRGDENFRQEYQSYFDSLKNISDKRKEFVRMHEHNYNEANDTIKSSANSYEDYVAKGREKTVIDIREKAKELLYKHLRTDTEYADYLSDSPQHELPSPEHARNQALSHLAKIAARKEFELVTNSKDYSALERLLKKYVKPANDNGVYDYATVEVLHPETGETIQFKSEPRSIGKAFDAAIEQLDKMKKSFVFTELFKPNLTTAVEEILAKNPNGIGAKKFIKELQDIHQKGTKVLEEAKISGLWDTLAELATQPASRGQDIPVDNKIVLDIIKANELRIMVEKDAKMDIQRSTEANWTLTGIKKDYRNLAIRMIPKKFWPAVSKSNNHIGPDCIAHARLTLRGDIEGSNFIHTEELQSNNNKKRAEVASKILSILQSNEHRDIMDKIESALLRYSSTISANSSYASIERVASDIIMSGASAKRTILGNLASISGDLTPYRRRNDSAFAVLMRLRKRSIDSGDWKTAKVYEALIKRGATALHAIYDSFSLESAERKKTYNHSVQAFIEHASPLLYEMVDSLIQHESTLTNSAYKDKIHHGTTKKLWRLITTEDVSSLRQIRDYVKSSANQENWRIINAFAFASIKPNAIEKLNTQISSILSDRIPNAMNPHKVQSLEVVYESVFEKQLGDIFNKWLKENIGDKVDRDVLMQNMKDRGFSNEEIIKFLDLKFSKGMLENIVSSILLKHIGGSGTESIFSSSFDPFSTITAKSLGKLSLYGYTRELYSTTLGELVYRTYADVIKQGLDSGIDKYRLGDVSDSAFIEFGDFRDYSDLDLGERLSAWDTSKIKMTDIASRSGTDRSDMSNAGLVRTGIISLLDALLQNPDTNGTDSIYPSKITDAPSNVSTSSALGKAMTYLWHDDSKIYDDSVYEFYGEKPKQFGGPSNYKEWLKKVMLDKRNLSQNAMGESVSNKFINSVRHAQDGMKYGLVDYVKGSTTRYNGNLKADAYGQSEHGIFFAEVELPHEDAAFKFREKAHKAIEDKVNMRDNFDTSMLRQLLSDNGVPDELINNLVSGHNYSINSNSIFDNTLNAIFEVRNSVGSKKKVNYKQIASKLARELAESSQGDEAKYVGRVMREMGYNVESEKDLRAFSNLPFTETKEWMKLLMKAIMREAISSNASHIVILNPLDCGPQTGLAYRKSEVIYSTQAVAEGDKVLVKEYGAKKEPKLPIVDKPENVSTHALLLNSQKENIADSKLAVKVHKSSDGSAIIENVVIKEEVVDEFLAYLKENSPSPYSDFVNDVQRAQRWLCDEVLSYVGHGEDPADASSVYKRGLQVKDLSTWSNGNMSNGNHMRLASFDDILQVYELYAMKIIQNDVNSDNSNMGKNDRTMSVEPIQDIKNLDTKEVLKGVKGLTDELHFRVMRKLRDALVRINNTISNNKSVVFGLIREDGLPIVNSEIRNLRNKIPEIRKKYPALGAHLAMLMRAHDTAELAHTHAINAISEARELANAALLRGEYPSYGPAIDGVFQRNVKRRGTAYSLLDIPNEKKAEYMKKSTQMFKLDTENIRGEMIPPSSKYTQFLSQLAGKMNITNSARCTFNRENIKGDMDVCEMNIVPKLGGSFADEEPVSVIGYYNKDDNVVYAKTNRGNNKELIELAHEELWTRMNQSTGAEYINSDANNRNFDAYKPIDDVYVDKPDFDDSEVDSIGTGLNASFKFDTETNESKPSWSNANAGFGRVVTSTEGYFISVVNKKFRLYNAQRALVGVYATEEEARKKADKFSRKGKNVRP